MPLDRLASRCQKDEGMETASMGKVIVSAKIENIEDLYELDKGAIAADQVRCLEVPNALVDTGATMLSLPNNMIETLGLKRLQARRARTTTGLADFDVYGTVQLTIQGRNCRVDVAEVSDECPALIGQVPLELLDFVVDPTQQRLVGNPDHGGEHMIDVF